MGILIARILPQESFWVYKSRNQTEKLDWLLRDIQVANSKEGKGEVGVKDADWSILSPPVAEYAALGKPTAAPRRLVEICHMELDTLMPCELSVLHGLSAKEGTPVHVFPIVQPSFQPHKKLKDNPSKPPHSRCLPWQSTAE